jgi:hypothetical protein
MGGLFASVRSGELAIGNRWSQLSGLILDEASAGQRICAGEASVPNAPQLAQLVQSRFHPFDGGRVTLRPTAPAQCLADLLERNFPAHRPCQYVGSDLADGLRGLPISLPMEELAFRLRHPRIRAEVDCNDAIKLDRLQAVGKAGVIPVMAIFLSGRVLLWREGIARESAFQRAVPHGDLTGMTARDVRAQSARHSTACCAAAAPRRRRSERISDHRPAICKYHRSIRRARALLPPRRHRASPRRSRQPIGP